MSIVKARTFTNNQQKEEKRVNSNLLFFPRRNWEYIEIKSNQLQPNHGDITHNHS